MPDQRFLHDMGVASLIAGMILLGCAHVMPAVKRVLP